MGSGLQIFVFLKDCAGRLPFKRGLDAFDFEKLNEEIAEEFVSVLAKQVQAEIAAREAGFAHTLRRVARHILPNQLCGARQTRPSYGRGGSIHAVNVTSHDTFCIFRSLLQGITHFAIFRLLS